MKHFQLHELVDQNTFDKFGDNAWSFFNPEFLIALDDLVDFFSDLKGEHCPVTVNNWHAGGPYQWRGFRTLEEAIAKGAPHSEHRYEPDVHLVNAADCQIGTYSAQEARQIIMAHKDHALLKRIMRMENGVPWVHWDLKQMTNRIYLFKA